MTYDITNFRNSQDYILLRVDRQAFVNVLSRGTVMIQALRSFDFINEILDAEDTWSANELAAVHRMLTECAKKI